MADPSNAEAPVVAHLVRDGRVESAHRGIGVVVDPSGKTLISVGDASALVYPRSTLKPVQTYAVLKLGTPLTPLEIALATASHQGTKAHRDGVANMLANHQLSVGLLQCPPDWPMSEEAKLAMFTSGEDQPSTLAMNCSGKHAGFLAACQHAGWDLESYLSVSHPLQQHIMSTVKTLAGEDIAHTTPDGCGAPLHLISLAGLARAVAKVTSGTSPESAALLDAVAEYPWAIAGHGHPNTRVISELGGLAKIGAEGLVVIAAPGGITAAVKIIDGSMRATTPLALTLLKQAGAIPAESADRLITATSTTVSGGTVETGGLTIVV